MAATVSDFPYVDGARLTQETDQSWLPRSDINSGCYTQQHKCTTKSPSLDKEGRRWCKRARGCWNPRGTHHPGHGLRPWHPLLSRGGEYSSVVHLCRHV